MPSYKLTYFNLRARGETPRMLFKLAGVEFEDVRVSFEDWNKLKPNLPMGQLPILEVDGVSLCQSDAIVRYLAREFGYTGKTSMEMAQVDMIGGCIADCTPKLLPIYELQGDAKVAYQEKYRTTVLEPYLKNMQNILEKNNGGNGFFYGDQITYPDLLFNNILDYAVYTSDAKNVLDNYPKLKAHRERVEKEPAIAKWIKERPESLF